jgi:hypothetical protein
MKAVGAADWVFFAERGLGLPHRVDHRLVDVGKTLLVLLGEFAVDVAEVRQRVVVGDMRGLVFHHLAGTEEVVVDRAGRADDDRFDARPFELLEHFPHIGFVTRADRRLPGLITAVVHAVAERGDGRLEDTQIVLQPIGEARGRFTAPPELKHLHVRHARAGQQVGFDVLAVELLLGDRVADDGDPCPRNDGRFAGLRHAAHDRKNRQKQRRAFTERPTHGRLSEKVRIQDRISSQSSSVSVCSR